VVHCIKVTYEATVCVQNDEEICPLIMLPTGNVLFAVITMIIGQHLSISSF
jgi:hypothetical protein